MLVSDIEFLVAIFDLIMFFFQFLEVVMVQAVSLFVPRII